MKLISLTKGQFAIVDDEDYEELCMWGWTALQEKSRGNYYAVKHAPGALVRMHRHLLGLEPGDKRVGDHINHNTLDNRRDNLRIATRGENVHNYRKPKHNTTGLKGVSWKAANGKYEAYINLNRKRIYLGLFDNPEDAHAAYCEAAIKHHGEFACFD